MAITYVDTDRLRDIASKIETHTNDYEREVNSLFKRFEEVPYSSKEWVGNQSEEYFKRVAMDKSNFIEIANMLRKYVKKINDDADRIEDDIKRIQEKESRGEM